MLESDPTTSRVAAYSIGPVTRAGSVALDAGKRHREIRAIQLEAL